MSKNLNKILEIADSAHSGQFRFDGVTPYISHPKAVADAFPADQDILKAIALLHDVLEDTSLTAQDLLTQGVSPFVVDVVEILTKRPNEDYDVYLTRIKTNWWAKRVKIQDILYNLGDSPSKSLVKKYAKALKFLLDPL